MKENKPIEMHPDLYKDVTDTEESLMAALGHLIDNKAQVLALSAWYSHTGSSGNQDLRGQVLLQSIDMWVLWGGGRYDDDVHLGCSWGLNTSDNMNILMR
jgi:hypothetical protein